MQEDGKRVRHSCGYPLLVRVLHQFELVRDGSVISYEGRGDVVVEYRDKGFLVWMCPQCFGELKLWWDSNGRWVGPQEPVFGNDVEQVECVEQVS